MPVVVVTGAADADQRTSWQRRAVAGEPGLQLPARHSAAAAERLPLRRRAENVHGGRVLYLAGLVAKLSAAVALGIAATVTVSTLRRSSCGVSLCCSGRGDSVDTLATIPHAALHVSFM